MSDDWEPLLPVLVHVQAHLDADLSLAALSRRARLSPAHFHRRFHQAVGETPRAYVERLRVERAAFRLVLHEATVLAIALECGFRNHETFIRAFRRHYGRTPASYRAWHRRGHVAARGSGRRSVVPPSRAEMPSAPVALSETRIGRLRPCHLAFIRHIGPYESVPEALFDRLAEWARSARVPAPHVWVGIGHDAPLTTAAARLRFDAALVVPAPFAPRHGVACQSFAGGDFAITTHAGSVQTLPAAYGTILPRVLRLRGYRFVGLPAVELYRTVRTEAGQRIAETDICLPVARTSPG
jgi:AraC family transcriptional regulator